MDHGACNVVYLDRRAQEELIRKDSVLSSQSADNNGNGHSPEKAEFFKLNGSARQQSAEVRNNVASILTIFNEVHVYSSGSSCMSKIVEFSSSPQSQTPIIVLIDVPYDHEDRQKRRSQDLRTPSPTSGPNSANPTGGFFDASDVYGTSVLDHLVSEIQVGKLSRLIVPIVVLSGFERDWASSSLPSPSVHGSQVLADSVRLTRYLDAGAVDVLASPISKDNAHGLAVHAYKAYKEAMREDTSFLSQRVHTRKLSWVGVEESRPYAYLREAMVSNLMNGICHPEMTPDMKSEAQTVAITAERKSAVADAVGLWSFSAHDFSDDELLYGASVMLEHALEMPELEKWRLPEDALYRFLHTSRLAYNSFVLYHNFRHVCDVLQAVFVFLVQIGSLPPYRSSPTPSTKRSAIATLVKPFDALTLLISAIGHDVGHPGVNNAFLVALNAPLAQLYNDRSVLESFHCAAYSQILRRFWPAAFEDVAMRKLMINSILATDMGLHFKYMSDLGNLQDKLHHNKDSLDGWSIKQQEEYRDLACGLLIKCADISNVARKFHVAAKWASILSDEFSNQGNMEAELNIPTQLFGGPPERDNIIKMAESQIGFMNIFARPLFEGINDIMPAMQFSVDQLLSNKATWEKKIEEEKGGESFGALKTIATGIASPLTQSHTDLPSTDRDETAVLPKGLKNGDLAQSGAGQTGSTGTAVDDLATDTPTDREDVKRKSQRSPIANAFSTTKARLRSVSPSKRKQRSVSERFDRLQSSPSQHRSPSETPPLPRLPPEHSRSQPNIHRSKESASTDDFSRSTEARSPSAMTDEFKLTGAGKRGSKLSVGLSKLWRSRKRTGKSHSAPMILPEDEHERERLANLVQEGS